MAEIATKDNNMLYGTFRIRMRVTNVPGTCTGFFWVNDFASFLDALADTSWMQYQSNVEEIDMELLSSSYNNTSKPIYLVMQTPMAAKDGYNVAGTSTFRIQQLPFEPSDSFHEYRFDWTNDRVVFYADGNRISSMTWTYPEEPGQLAVNHWSNGNALWSKGPPNEAAVTTIEWVKAYYNSSNTDKDAEHAIRCPGLESSQICVVPDFSSSHPVDVFYQNRTMCGESDVDGGSPSKVEKTADAASSKTSMTTTQRTMPLSRALASIEWWLLLAMVTAFIATMY